MSYLEPRSVIKFLTKKQKKPKEIQEGLTAVFGSDAPSYYQVKVWAKQFKWGRGSFGASSEEMCCKVEAMILDDRCVKVSVIAHELGTSVGTVSSITCDVLMSKVRSQWMPQITPEQKTCCQQLGQEKLEVLGEYPGD